MNRGRMFALLSLSLSACSFSGSDGTPGGGGNEDPDGGMTDAMPIDAPPAPPKCEFSEIDMCAETASGPLSFTANTTINTSMDAMCPHLVPQEGDGLPLCVYYADSISIAANINVRAIGTRPLVFVSRKGISIAGTLNASSTRVTNNGNPEVLGAGAESGECADFPNSAGAATAGGGGGAGGSFSGKGGNGGEGGDPNPIVPNDGVDGGSSPNAMPLADVDFFRGGCRGQIGGDDGDSSNQAAPGVGGPPGGALYLAASGDITILLSGKIAANGGGGRGGAFLTGGGGGGSGGMILLEARTVERFGAVVANGGGGGEGGGTLLFPGNPATPGSGGSDGGMTGNPASGGNNVLLQGVGGDGSDAGRRDGRSGTDSGDGGAGGGGAAGFIRIIGTPTGTGIVSPTASPPPP